MEKKVVTWDFLNCPWQPKVVKGFSLFDIQQSPNRKILSDQQPTIFGYHNPRLIMHLRNQKMCCTALSAFKVGLIMLFPTFILLSFHVSDSCWRSPLIFELSLPLTRLPSIALVDLLWDSERSHRRILPPCSWDGGFWVQLWQGCSRVLMLCRDPKVGCLCSRLWNCLWSRHYKEAKLWCITHAWSTPSTHWKLKYNGCVLITGCPLICGTTLPLKQLEASVVGFRRLITKQGIYPTCFWLELAWRSFR